MFLDLGLTRRTFLDRQCLQVLRLGLLVHAVMVTSLFDPLLNVLAGRWGVPLEELTTTHAPSLHTPLYKWKWF